MSRVTEWTGFCKMAKAILKSVLVVIWDLANGDDLESIDMRVREEGGRFLREALGLALSHRGRKERYGKEVECRCGGTAEFRQYRTYRVATVLPGKTVEVKAAYYLCEKCRKGVVPLLRELRADADGMTPGLRELVVLAGTIDPYEDASENLLAKFAGVSVCGSEVQMKAVEEGEAVGEYLREVGLRASDKASEEIPDEAMVVAIDGGMIHVDDRWQEVKLGVVYGEGDRVEISEGRCELVSRDVIAVRGGPEQLAALMESRLAPFRSDRRTVLVLGDGAKWIWNMAEDLFPNRVEILDYYHAVEHLSQCAAAVFGQASPEACKWLDEQRGRLLDDKVRIVIESLAWLRARFKSQPKRQAIASLECYLENNAHRMSYKTFMEKGCPIGSGPVESAVKHVVQCRMKRPGTHWRARGADAMLSLRSLYRSKGRWDAYWQYNNSAKSAA